MIDASVAAKWFLPGADEPLADEATHFLRRYSRGEIRFIVPDLFWAELGNIMWKAVRQGRWSKAAANHALAEMKDRNLPTVPTVALLDQAFAIATSFDRTLYDSLYVALAIASKAELVTADLKLANSLAAHLPVKWLGAV
ncbi:MAG: type II toxin-antitoxin system VapC family toxin [Terriglobia bacterium]